ncbi:MAG: DegT/DnrJ/EryC1/StrS family aminotransferase [Candidatus Bathyarchaeia archaeon]
MAQLALKGGKPVRTRPFRSWHIYDERELKNIKEVLQSDIWGGFFPFLYGEGGEPRPTKIEELEERFARYHDAKYGICTTSGTIAMESALRAVGVGQNDEVIIPTIASGCNALVNAALGVGAIPIFVDIDPFTYCIDPVKVEEAITDKTRAIIPVHFGGYLADIDRLIHLSQSHNMFLIEDACQAHGGKWRGKGVGSFGDLGCFSFQDFKLMTSGEGGIIITNNAKYDQMCHSYVNCGRIRQNDVYHEEVLGNNYRMTEIQAAILLAQFERLPEQTKKRQENARYLSKELSQIEGIEPLQSTPEQAYYYYIFKYDKKGFNNVPLDLFIKALQEEGIPVKRLIPPEYMFIISDTHYPQFCRYYSENTEQARAFVKRRSQVAIKAYEESAWIHHSVLLGSVADMDDIIMAIDKIKKHAKELETLC